jgi:hypothetical protein
MNKPVLRRAAALLATPALALATVAALPSAPSYAAETDPAPAQAGAAWLTAQLTDGLVQGAYFDGTQDVAYTDYGLSADIALALDELGADSTVSQISDALAADVATWHSSFATVDAGAVAKSLLVAQAAGDDVANFGGVNLVEKLEGLIEDDDAAPTFGRLRNVGTDFKSGISQALAVQGLDRLGAPSAALGPATEFLLEQQCANGSFRQTLSDETLPAQSCDADSSSTPDTDATAISVLALESQLDDDDVAAAVGRAVTWLQSQQLADGSFGGGTSTESPNSNSTGLAASALHTSGAVAAAEAASGWLRAHQLTNVGSCTNFGAGDLGAIAYDDAGLAAAAAEDIVVTSADQYRRAASQALPALRWATETAGSAQASTVAGFVRARTTVAQRVTGADPGEAVCVTGPLNERRQVNASRTGTASVLVTLPAGTADRVVRIASSDGVDTATYRVLAAKRLPFNVKKSVRKGTKQSIRVTGLAAGERVTVTLQGKRVATGKATRAGVFVKRFRVGAKLGRARVKVVGQFADRTNTKTVRVTR